MSYTLTKILFCNIINVIHNDKKGVKMKDIKHFYDESPTKIKTRYKILDAAEELFSNNGIEAVTMVEIADKTEITVRNLYRYYPNIELLAVDTAYYIFNRKSDFIDRFTIEKDTGYEQIKKIINNFADEYLKKSSNHTTTKFTMYFDIFISKMDKNHPAFIKYTKEYVTQINNEIKNIVEKALEKGVNDKSIIKIDDIGLYAEFILQSLVSLIMRIDIKEYENPLINSKLLEIQIKMILEHIKNNI